MSGDKRYGTIATGTTGVATEEEGVLETPFTKGKRLIEEQKFREAARLLKKIYDTSRDNPGYISYYGMAVAIGNGEIKRGLELCTKAIKKEFYRPEFYANLANVYMAAGNKKGAITALSKGLKYETRGDTLHNMLVELGVRKGPVLPFLKRSSRINKFLGIFFRRTISRLGGNNR